MTQKISEEQVKLANKTLIEGLFSDDNSMRKRAAETVNEYQRIKMYENGLYRALYSPGIYNGPWHPQFDTEEPAYMFGIEPDVPKVISIPFGTSTEATEFFGRKGRVVFSPIQSRKFRKDKRLLTTELGDLRSWITDKSLFMIHDEEDSRLFGGIDYAISNGTGLANQVLPELDEPLWKEISGGWVRETFAECTKVLPNSRSDTATGQGFPVHTMIINRNLATEMLKWADGMVSEQLLEDVDNTGWTRDSYLGVELLITGKRHLVGDDEVYMVGPRKDSAKTHLMSDVRLHSKAEVNMLEWLSEETLGLTINPYCFAKVTLT